MRNVVATNANFIKLGNAGGWELECLRDGVLRFGYEAAPHHLCVAGQWDEIWTIWRNIRGDSGTATRDVNQIKAFYESGEDTIFITFAHGLLYWCRPTGGVEEQSDGTRLRRTVDGWIDASLGGKRLTMDKLSGNLLKVQMFRGTICRVKETEYLLRKLGDELSPEVMAAEEAERSMILAITGLMRLLTWQDFEMLVDLVFSNSGWRRVSVLGQVQKTIDLELLLPSTGERAFVQVKAEANARSLSDYTDRFKETTIYSRMFFVWHSGVIPVEAEARADGITLLGPARLARMVFDAGLASWLREKVS